LIWLSSFNIVFASQGSGIPNVGRYREVMREETMRQLCNVLALTLAGVVAAGAVGIQPLYAQDKKEYVPQNVKRERSSRRGLFTVRMAK
jgi:hypothetical protein